MHKIIGEIPARYGSKRVKHKNLRPLSGKPLVSYAINAAKNASSLSEVYVNSESDLIGKIALDNGVKYYKRKAELATDSTLSDEFNYDFIKSLKPDILVMINPVCPLITGPDIDEIVNFFLKNDSDTLITVREEKLQAFCENKAINFNPDSQLPRTQDIPPIQLCVWPVCVWRAKTFMKAFEEKGYAVFSGKVALYPINPLKAIKISAEDDFLLAEALLNFRNRVKE